MVFKFSYLWNRAVHFDETVAHCIKLMVIYVVKMVYVYVYAEPCHI